MTPISPEAREAAAQEISKWLSDGDGCQARGFYVQILLDAQREKIIKECAEIVDQYDQIISPRPTAKKVRDAILAKARTTSARK